MYGNGGGGAKQNYHITYLDFVVAERSNLWVLLRLDLLDDVGIGCSGPAHLNSSDAGYEFVSTKCRLCACILWDSDNFGRHGFGVMATEVPKSGLVIRGECRSLFLFRPCPNNVCERPHE